MLEYRINHLYRSIQVYLDNLSHENDFIPFDDIKHLQAHIMTIFSLPESVAALYVRRGEFIHLLVKNMD